MQVKLLVSSYASVRAADSTGGWEGQQSREDRQTDWYIVCFCSPVKRMTVGMFLAAMAFVAAALVQLQIDVRTTLAAVSLFVLFGHAFL